MSIEFFYSEHNDKNVYPDILKVIGNTPLIKLNQIPKEAGLKCDVYAKVELKFFLSFKTSAPNLYIHNFPP